MTTCEERGINEAGIPFIAFIGITEKYLITSFSAAEGCMRIAHINVVVFDNHVICSQ